MQCYILFLLAIKTGMTLIYFLIDQCGTLFLIRLCAFSRESRYAPLHNLYNSVSIETVMSNQYR